MMYYTGSTMTTDGPTGSGDAPSDHEGLTEIYQTTCGGPYLSCFGRKPLFSGRVLEVWVQNPKGVLPATILDRDDTKLTEQLGSEDPWIRRLLCRVQMLGVNRYKVRQYLVKVYVPISRDVTTDEESSTVDADTTESDKPIIEAINIRPDLDGCPTIDCQGLAPRSHARGLVTKDLLHRMDGLEGLGDYRKLGCFRGTSVNLCVSLFPPWDFSDKLFTPRTLTGINAACVTTLLNTLFDEASVFDRLLRPMYTPVTTKAVPPIYSPLMRRCSLTFDPEVKVIPDHDELSAPEPELQDTPISTDTVLTQPPVKPKRSKIRKIFSRLFSCLPLRRRKED